MKTKKLFTLLSFLTLALGAFSFLLVGNNKTTKVVDAATYNQSVNDYYSNIDWDLTGSSLKSALATKIKIDKAGWSYDGLYEAYKTTDVRNDGIHLWDIYADSSDYTLNDKRINASYKKEGDSLNREHIIPQSSFNKAAPMKSDIHHVLPSDGYVNNRRGSYPHDDVVSGVTYTSNDGCKLGNNASGTKTFEPMPQYKGDIARIYFYFVTCYQHKMSSNSFSAFDQSTYPSIKEPYLSTYLKWAKEDPVSEKEINRNQAAYEGQGNRNPFVDCPYAVGAIWDSNHASDYGNKGEYTSGEGLTISKTSISLISGNSATLSASSTNSSNISWTTSNSSVASISSSSTLSGANLTVTAGSTGTTTITASASINGKIYTKTCSVTVSATKQVTAIVLSGQKTYFTVDDEFEFGGKATASFNDDTTSDVTSQATFNGYDMSAEGNQTVTVTYTFGGSTVTATYGINVSKAGGGGSSEDISDYTVSTTRLTSSAINNGMKVAFGTSPTNLAESIGSNWIYLSSTPSDWLVFTLEGNSDGFTLKHGDSYIYCSGAKKVEFSSNSTTFTLSVNDLVNSSLGGTFYFNGTGLRPYTSGSYDEAYLYPLIPNKSLTEIDIDTYPNKLTYTVGEKFDPTGLVISRGYDDSSSDTYAYAGHTTEFTFNPSTITPLSIDDDTIEVTYGGQSCFFKIDVEYPDVLESIEISGYKTSFVEGDAFSFEGTVMATFESGSVLDVTSACDFKGYDMTKVGQQTVTVSYLDQDKTYQIDVAIGTLSSLIVEDQTTVYTKNSSFSFDGNCIAVFANGYQKEVNPTSVSSPDMSTTGTKIVTVSYSYNGKTVSTSYNITVNSYRVVMEEIENEIGTITYTNDKEEISVSTLSTTSSGGYSSIDTQYHAWRLGAGSKTGTLTVKSTSTNIYKIVVNAKYYSSDSGTRFTIGGTSYNLTSSFTDYTKAFDSAVNQVAISSVANGKRVLIASIVVYTKTEEDIGQTEDCLGLETYINNYMHMDYIENLGYCNDSEHHYYATAKAAFNDLNDHQRALFTGNSAYHAEWTRLSTWASKNGDSLSSSNNKLIITSIVDSTESFESNSALITIIAVSALSTCVLLSLLIIKKRRYRE